eukprot:CAMPEP_0173351516 /NCGR_PEP_ID=MMETSP1144-20121109/15501_1 /TAXON_ID=483371 /ORGANISM="non described non described, Strain CCMP2298" /LENGTH=34 /DNA_ID= /DNA_START= /DNA_END= /DNA_ORIENTATION=
MSAPAVISEHLSFSWMLSMATGADSVGMVATCLP